MAWQSFVTLRSLREGTMGLIYIMICLLLNDEVHSSFQVKKFLNKFSWETAKQNCNRSGDNLTIAVPRVELCSLKVLEKLDLKGEAWVGYFQTYEYFMFIACVPLSEIERSVSEKFKFVKCENRPGMCYSVCGLRGYIGLLDDVCYCIVQRNFSTPDIKGDNTSCEDPLHCVNNGMLCGNREYNKISVYKNVAISSNDIKGNGSGCLVVTKGRKYELSVANCSDRFHHLCESYYGPMLYLEESPSNDQWMYSFRDCIKTSKKPTTFIGESTTFIFPTINGSWWTSVVRDLVIRNYSESMIINETSVYQGFLRNSAEGTKLDFIHVRNSLRMTSVACMSGKESTPEVSGIENTTSSESTLLSHSTLQTTKALVTYEQSSTKQETPSIKQAGTTTTPAAPEETTTPLIYEETSTDQGTTLTKQAGTTILSAAPEITTTPLIYEETSTDQGTTLTKQAGTTILSAAPEITTTPLISEETSTDQGTTSTKQAGTTILSAAPEITTTPLISDQPGTEQNTPTIAQAETTIMSATPNSTTTLLIPVSTVILLVGLAALALITVVTLSCVCWRRLEAKATKNEEASKHKSTENVVPHNSKTYKMYDEHEKVTFKQLKEKNQVNVSSEYDILKEDKAPVSAFTGNIYDTSNFNIAEGTYAVSCSSKTLRMVVPKESYDHVRMKKTDNGTYDHVELQDQRNRVIGIDTYDQCNVLALDKTYYDTCQDKFNLHQQLEGNVYHTANFHPT